MMFNSPTAFCTVRRAYVAIDQTQPECALEHGCEPDTNCPLESVFARRESVDSLRFREIASVDC